MDIENGHRKCTLEMDMGIDLDMNIKMDMEINIKVDMEVVMVMKVDLGVCIWMYMVI